MSTYFSYFPIISYEGKAIRDITRRSKFLDERLSDPFTYLPYTIREGERPEDLSNSYYGSVGDTWLILLANKITDPYTQWPLSETDFHSFFIEKYKALSELSGSAVVEWGQDQTLTENLVYHYRTSPTTGKILRVAPDTFLTLNSQELGPWKQVRVYDYEKQMNENKREIILIDKQYRNEVVKNFRKTMNTV